MTKAVPQTSVNKLKKLAAMSIDELLKFAGIPEHDRLLTVANRVIYQMPIGDTEGEYKVVYINPAERWLDHMLKKNLDTYAHLHRKGGSTHGDRNSHLAQNGFAICTPVYVDFGDFVDGPEWKDILTVCGGSSIAQAAYTWLEHSVPSMPVLVAERALEAIKAYKVKPATSCMDEGFKEEFFDEIVLMMNCLDPGIILADTIKSNPDQVIHLGVLNQDLWDVHPRFWKENDHWMTSRDLLAEANKLPEANLLAYFKLLLRIEAQEAFRGW